MSKPLIGIVLDHEATGSFSDLPHYALREHYFKAIEKAGGTPIGLGYLENPYDYFDNIQGLVSPGGGFACPSDWYLHGEESHYTPSKRFTHDVEFIKLALEHKLPFLGICAGMQLLAGVTGCKMIPDINTHHGTDLEHRGIPKEEGAHLIDIAEGTRLHALMNESQITVNSSHIEAIVTTHTDIVVSATSPDGIIEAIEHKDHPFAIGVQWHPEMPISEDDPSARLLNGFITEAKNYKR